MKKIKKKNKKKLTQVEGQKKKLFKVQLLKIIPSFTSTNTYNRFQHKIIQAKISLDIIPLGHIPKDS